MAVPARIGQRDHPFGSGGHAIEQVCIDLHARPRDGLGLFARDAPSVQPMRGQVEDPLRRGLVLPLPRLQQVASDRHGAGPAHPLGGLGGVGEAEHLVPPGDQHANQLRADEPAAPVTNAVALVWPDMP